MSTHRPNRHPNLATLVAIGLGLLLVTPGLASAQDDDFTTITIRPPAPGSSPTTLMAKPDAEEAPEKKDEGATKKDDKEVEAPEMMARDSEQAEPTPPAPEEPPADPVEPPAEPEERVAEAKDDGERAEPPPVPTAAELDKALEEAERPEVAEETEVAEEKPPAEAEPVAAPKKAVKKAPVKKAKRKQTRVLVVGAYRPVDFGRDKRYVATQAGLDLYLDIADRPSLKVGSRYPVFRRIRSPSVMQSKVTIQVGEVEVLAMENDLAIARVTAGPKRGMNPFLQTPGVVIGDFVDPARVVAEAKPEPAPAKRRRAGKRRKRAKRAMAKAPKAESTSIAPRTDPVLEDGAGDRDPDSFLYWDEKPIDF